MIEEKKTIRLKINKKQLAILKELILYLYSVNKLERTNNGGIKLNPPLSFNSEAIRKENSTKVSLILPQSFTRYCKNIEIQSNLLLRNIEFSEAEYFKSLEILEVNKDYIVLDICYIPFLRKQNEERFLSIDLGIKNPVTTVDSLTGDCCILGRDYVSHAYYFNKQISRLESIYIGHGLGNFNTKKMLKVTKKRDNTLSDILHKITHFLSDYCIDRSIYQVVVGNIQEKSESIFPYEKFYSQLSNKLFKFGILITKQSEAYTSQCSPKSPLVSKEYAVKENRITRGLYKDGDALYNADGLGAFNILRSYFSIIGKRLTIPLDGIIDPIIINVI